MKICTFSRDLGGTIEAMTADEWRDGGKTILDGAADEWVWQDCATKEQAMARHEAAHERWRGDIDAGRPEQAVY